MKKQQFDTIIIGAGASGLVAAIEASLGGGRVLVLERMDAPGKKILATGNGKCNMTNIHMEGDCYRGSGLFLAQFALSQMPPQKLCRYFYDLGLHTRERDGYVYPVTEQAKTCLLYTSCSAVSPPIKAQPACTQPSATPATIAATFSGKFRPQAI